MMGIKAFLAAASSSVLSALGTPYKPPPNLFFWWEMFTILVRMARGQPVVTRPLSVSTQLQKLLDSVG